MIEDAAATFQRATLRTGVCVIGSGAAGITLAHQLDGSGLDVTVLETGGSARDPVAERDAFVVSHAGEPWRNPEPDRGRGFGGSTALWFGRIAKPDPIEFGHRPWIPHSGWPITLDEVEPWMHTAATILDVPAFDKISTERWPANATFDAFDRAQLGVFLWARGMRMGEKYQPALRASANVRVVLNATVTELVPNEGVTAVDHVVVRREDQSRIKVEADVFVLAAGGLENARLLLASNTRVPQGLGNAADVVGRYYMDHPRGEGLASVDLRGLSSLQLDSLRLLGEKARSEYGHVQLRLKFTDAMQRRERLLNHSLHAHLVSDVHDSTAFRSLVRMRRRMFGQAVERGPDDPRGADLRNVVRASPSLVAHAASVALRRHRPTRLVVVDQMEQEPDPASRVDLAMDRRDRFGVPTLRVDWRIGESTYRSQQRMHELFRDLLKRIGIHAMRSSVLDRTDQRPELWDMKHPMGTTRMSASPRDGVVDESCRVHGLTNLYVAGSSVFPIGGHANPTLLIVALAARLADHLRRGHRR